MSKIKLELEFDDVTLIQRALQTVSGHSSSAAGQLIQRIAEQEAEQVSQMDLDYVVTVHSPPVSNLRPSSTVYSVRHPMSTTKMVTATHENGLWVPEGAYDNGKRMVLPSYFSFSPGALAALEACRLEQEA